MSLTKEQALSKVKEWYTENSSNLELVKKIFSREGITIGANKYYSPMSGHRVYINVKLSNGEDLTIIDLGSPDTIKEGLDTLIKKLNNITGGRKKRTSKKSTSKKSTLKKRTSKKRTSKKTTSKKVKSTSKKSISKKVKTTSKKVKRTLK